MRFVKFVTNPQTNLRQVLCFSCEMGNLLNVTCIPCSFDTYVKLQQLRPPKNWLQPGVNLTSSNKNQSNSSYLTLTKTMKRYKPRGKAWNTMDMRIFSFTLHDSRTITTFLTPIHVEQYILMKYVLSSLKVYQQILCGSPYDAVRCPLRTQQWCTMQPIWFSPDENSQNYRTQTISQTSI